jgi:hypothetical protein
MCASSGIARWEGTAVRHKGELIVRFVMALLTLGIAGCLVLFVEAKKLTGPMIAAYLVSVFACGVFATAWPWRGNSRARIYALLGVLWTSTATGAWLHTQTMTATLYGVAAALSFWASLITVSLRSETHAGQVAQLK